MTPQPTRIYLWDYRILYMGPHDGPVTVNHTIDIIALSLDAPLTLQHTGDRSMEVGAVLVPAAHPLQLTSRGTLVLCTLDVFRIERPGFLNRFEAIPGDGCWRLPDHHWSRLRQGFAEIYRSQAACDQVHSRVRELLGVEGWEWSQSPLDRRVVECLLRMRRQIEPKPSNQALATAVNLSPSRLEHLFKTELGCTIGRMWMALRSRHFLYHLAEQGNLTAAALSAGFFDSAHFSRTFKELFGISPRQAYSGKQRLLQIYR